MAQPALVINNTENATSLRGYITTFVDSTSQLSLSRVRELSKAGKVKLHRSDVFYFRAQASTQWLHFSLTNSTSKPIAKYLIISSAHVNKATLWYGDLGQEQQKGPVGDLFPFSKRLIRSPHLVIPIVIPAYHTVPYWLRLEQWNGVMAFHLTLKSNSAFERQTEQELVIWSAVGGLLLTLILFNFFLWINLRQRLYLIYTLYVFTIILYLAAETGFGFQFFWPTSVRFQNSSRATLGLGTLFWWLWLMQLFLQQTPTNDWWYYWVQALKGLILSCEFLIFFVLYFVEYTNGDLLTTIYSILIDTGLLIGVILLGIVGSLVEQIRRKNPLAHYYAFATLPMLLGVLIGVLFRNGVLDGLVDSYIPVAIGIVLETILIAFGFSFRYNLDQRQKQELQQALHIAHAQIITTQDTERQRIAADLHDDLGGVIATINHQLTQSLQSYSFQELQQKVTQIKLIAAQVGDQIRSISHNLMPPDFEQIGLVESVQQLVGSLHDARFRFATFGETKRLSPEVELNAYRILAELIHNAQKHAQAQQVSVQLLFHKDSLTLMVEDDGIGNHNEQSERKQKGIGLRNIASRVNYLHARWQTDATRQGTTTLIEIPYERVSVK